MKLPDLAHEQLRSFHALKNPPVSSQLLRNYKKEAITDNFKVGKEIMTSFNIN